MTMTEAIAVETRWYVNDPETLGLRSRSIQMTAKPAVPEWQGVSASVRKTRARDAAERGVSVSGLSVRAQSNES